MITRSSRGGILGARVDAVRVPPWERYYGRQLPRGSSALMIEGDRILSGQAVIVGVEGIHWAMTGVASVA